MSTPDWLIEKLGLTFDSMITMPGEDDVVCLYSMSLANTLG